jgi:hypothetical protein
MHSSSPDFATPFLRATRIFVYSSRREHRWGLCFLPESAHGLLCQTSPHYLRPSRERPGPLHSFPHNGQHPAIDITDQHRLYSPACTDEAQGTPLSRFLEPESPFIALRAPAGPLAVSRGKPHPAHQQGGRGQKASVAETGIPKRCASPPLEPCADPPTPSVRESVTTHVPDNIGYPSPHTGSPRRLTRVCFGVGETHSLPSSDSVSTAALLHVPAEANVRRKPRIATPSRVRIFTA